MNCSLKYCKQQHGNNMSTNLHGSDKMSCFHLMFLQFKTTSLESHTCRGLPHGCKPFFKTAPEELVLQGSDGAGARK